MSVAAPDIAPAGARFELGDDGIGTIVIDRPNDTANARARSIPRTSVVPSSTAPLLDERGEFALRLLDRGPFLAVPHHDVPPAQEQVLG